MDAAPTALSSDREKHGDFSRSFICGADGDSPKARRTGAVAGAHGLHGLSLAAVGRAPERPVVAGADGIPGIPELGGDAGIRGVLEHAAELAALDLPSDLGAELEVVALVVDGPGTVGLHINAAVGTGNELLEAERLFAGQDADVGHADD